MFPTWILFHCLQTIYRIRCSDYLLVTSWILFAFYERLHLFIMYQTLNWENNPNCDLILNARKMKGNKEKLK